VYIKKPLKQVKRGFEVEILLKFFSLVEPVTYFGTPPVDPAGRCVKSFGLKLPRATFKPYGAFRLSRQAA